jgi:hypothetical protein
VPISFEINLKKNASTRVKSKIEIGQKGIGQKGPLLLIEGIRKGQKGYFIALLSHTEREINILIRSVSSSKFGNNKSVYQQNHFIFNIHQQREVHF